LDDRFDGRRCGEHPTTRPDDGEAIQVDCTVGVGDRCSPAEVRALVEPFRGGWVRLRAHCRGVSGAAPREVRADHADAQRERNGSSNTAPTEHPTHPGRNGINPACDRTTAGTLTRVPDDLESGADLDRIAEWLRGASFVTALAGAGMSTGSGIPDFRGP